MMRSRLAAHLSRLAWLALGEAIVFAPFRYRLVLQARPFPPLYSDYTDLLLFTSDLFILLTLVTWTLGLALEPRRLRLGPRFLSLPIVGLTGLGFASVAVSVDPPLSLYHAIRLLGLAGLYLYVVNEIRSPEQIVPPVALQVSIQAVVGVAQVLRQSSLGLHAAGELALDPAQAGTSIVVAGGVRSLRAYGLSAHPNILGGCLAFALLLLTGWYVRTTSRWRVTVVGLFALGLLNLLLTFSRAAWLAFGGGLILGAILLWVTRQRRELAVGLGLVAVGLIVVAPFAWRYADFVGVRLNQGDAFSQVPTERRSIAERGALNEAAGQVFVENAWTGVGLGALPAALQRRFPDFAFLYQPAHFVPLDVAAEVGILGAVLFLVVTTGPWLALWRERGRLVWSPALIGTSSAVLAVSIVGFFDYYTWLLPPGRLWQWLIWGLWGAVYATHSSHQVLGRADDAPG